jgi:CheY-like chemotaxis protein
MQDPLRERATATWGCSAVVADRRPLERALIVFLLEEQGVRVAAEADTMSDVLSMARQHAPDVIVIHERLTLDQPPAVLARIRRISPGTEVVVFAASGDDVRPALVLAADAIVEDAGALTDLAKSLASRGGERPDVVARGSHRVPVAEPVPPDQPQGSSSRRVGRWVDRVQGVIAATMIVSLFVFVRADMLPLASASPEAREHLDAAFTAYERLEAVSETSPPETISAIAQRLLLERHLAEAGGANVWELDLHVKGLLLRLVPSLPEERATSLVRTLGPLFTEDEMASLQSLEWLWLDPSWSPSVEPSDPPVAATPAPPTEDPTAPPSEVPTAPPSEVPTAPTSEVPTAPPSEVPTAPPSEDPTPPPSEDPTPPPSEDPMESPSEDPTPPPSEDPTPPPSEDPSPTSAEPTPPADEPSTATEEPSAPSAPSAPSEDPGAATEETTAPPSEDPSPAPATEPSTSTTEAFSAPPTEDLITATAADPTATAADPTATAAEPTAPASEPSVAG